MKRSRQWFLWGMAAVMATVCAGHLMAAESGLEAAARKLMEAVGNGKTVEVLKAAKALKDAGFAYQESLLAPREGIIDCKDRRDQLQVLVGIYSTDMNYAAYFGKSKAVRDLDEFVHKDVMERMLVRPKIKVNFHDPGLDRRIYEAADVDQAALDARFAEIEAMFEKLVKSARRDPDVLDYMVDRLFGAALEFIYLSCRLSLGSPGGEQLIPVFNLATARIDTVLPVLEALKEPALQASLMRTERIMCLNAVKDIIQKKGGRLAEDDLRRILSLVEPIRESYVAKCK